METSVSRAINDAMIKIHNEIYKVSHSISSLEWKFSSLSTDVTCKITAQSNRIDIMEEQIVPLQSEIEDMKTIKDSTKKLLAENILHKTWLTIWTSRPDTIVFA